MPSCSSCADLAPSASAAAALLRPEPFRRGVRRRSAAARLTWLRHCGHVYVVLQPWRCSPEPWNPGLWLRACTASGSSHSLEQQSQQAQLWPAGGGSTASAAALLQPSLDRCPSCLCVGRVEHRRAMLPRHTLCRRGMLLLHGRMMQRLAATPKKLVHYRRRLKQEMAAQHAPAMRAACGKAMYHLQGKACQADIDGRGGIRDTWIRHSQQRECQ